MTVCKYLRGKEEMKEKSGDGTEKPFKYFNENYQEWSSFGFKSPITAEF